MVALNETTTENDFGVRLMNELSISKMRVNGPE